MRIEFTITKEYEGLRLDVILAKLMEELSRSYIQKLFSDERITVNGTLCKEKKYLAKEGDFVELEYSPKTDRPPEGEDIPLDIVYEDGDVLVVNKPKGMVVHPGRGNENGTLVNALLGYLGEEFRLKMKDVCDEDRPGIVHRIDKDTTGLLVVAKTEESFLNLSGQFRNHSITRRYLALVYNNFKEDEGRIDIPIGRDPKNRLRRALNGIEPREAITNYRVIERMGNYNYIEATLETGRTHQIRVHMAGIGHPVVGDPTYGPRRDILGAAGQMLHACTIGFNQLQGDYLELYQDPPKGFLDVLAKARR